ncbi:hypothetical protein [Cronobacter sakazakii]|uniref:hypothetical protein n=1 Tax=Cronobacter sakazakii TaxID=28141 RepID=UPI0028941B03|nr:hypothetical protein [Cronobacter sakazakii]MDT3518930.1 hypothetical protein [Cronobacter sakazakii]
MKLIDLLVQELPKRGGWPDGAVECCRHKGSNSIDFYDANGNWPVDCALKYGKDFAAKSEYNENNPRYLVDSVTREQYEAALAAAQQPVWDGEGLPPVGCECEAIYGRDVWFKVKIIAYDSGRVIGRWLEGDRDDDLLDYSHQESFRPIRSEADRKREIGVIALATACGDVVPFKYGDRLQDGELVGAAWYELYDKIAAGEIAGIRIE